MLQFVIGTAGTGKTNYLLNLLDKDIKSEKKTIILVPEQFSFETERQIYKKYGAQSSLFVEVLSFTRLCNNIFRKFGGLAGIPISKTGKTIVMSIAIAELEGSLETYKKSAQNISFVQTMLAVCDEFKIAGISPDNLKKIMKMPENVRLKNKLRDIYLVYSTYQALIEKGYRDGEDDIMRACESLENNDFFKEFNVYVDGFTTFMAGEFELLSHIIKNANKTIFAMTTDAIEENTKTTIFAPVNKAIEKLIKISKANDIFIENTIILTEPKRYNNNELAFLSKEFLKPKPNAYINDISNIKYIEQGSAYEEIHFVASEICKLVRENGYKYKDFAIIGRETHSYNHIFSLVLPKYEIPYFTDEKINTESSMLFSGIINGIKAIINNFDVQSIIMLAKSPIMGLNLLDVAQLENYCYIWDVRGQIWHTDFINNPKGMAKDFTKLDEEKLKEINVTRKKIIEPLLVFKDSLSDTSGFGFSKAIFSFIENINASQNISAYATILTEAKSIDFLDFNSQLWDSLIEILDIFGSVLGSIKMNIRKLYELLILAINSTEIGIIPQTLDQLLIGSADRIRPGQLKVVFVIGVNEGIFPGSISNNGIFSTKERDDLIASGLEIASGGLQKSLLEQFFGYFALNLASDKLYISSITSNFKGEEMLPSIFINNLKNIFGERLLYSPTKKDLVQTYNAALSLFSAEFNNDTILRATLYKFLQNNIDVIDKMKKAAFKPAHSINNFDLATQLFGQKMYLSPSRVERYNKCPFSYFVQDGLNVSKRKKVDFSPLESGSIIHHVLQVMLQNHGGKGLSELSLKDIEDEIAMIIFAYMETRIEDKDNFPARTKFLFNRLKTTLAKLVQHMGNEFKQSLYNPIEFELPIKQDEGIKPFKLITPDGITILVEGVVDRVDVMESKGKKYIRVVDYKSGSKKFRLDDVMNGLNLQMLLYLFTIQEHGTNALGGAIPAGVLYMPIKESYSNIERDENYESIENKLVKQWTMSGLLLDDEDSLRGMEEELQGIFIPTTLKKDGSYSNSSAIASNSHMGMLSRKVKAEIVKVAQELSQGKISAIPIDDVDYPSCQYCEYREICGYEEGDIVKCISKMNQEEVFRLLEKEEDHSE